MQALLPSFVDGGAASNGGIVPASRRIIIPGVNNNYVINANFDCENTSTLIFRTEDMEDGATTTIKRVLVKYRNLGIVTILITITGRYFATSKTVVLGDNTVPYGNLSPTPMGLADNKIYNALIDFNFTDESPQFTIHRDFHSGPLALIKLAVYGDKHSPGKQ